MNQFCLRNVAPLFRQLLQPAAPVGIGCAADDGHRLFSDRSARER